MSARVAPPEVRAAFAEGLRLHREGLGGRGLRPRTLREARAVVAGKPVSIDKARRMVAWFARHGASAAERAARRRQREAVARGRAVSTAPAWVAWLLWGGDAGRRWARRRVDAEA